MPQMGESIAEGTVSKWLKQVGDSVDRDEAILEISTDKVDAEIPAPSSGTLVEISVPEGETVEVGTVLAHIDSEGGAPVAAPPVADARVEEVPVEKAAVAAETAPDSESAARPPAPPPPPASADISTDQLPTRSTPVVRRIAEEHGVDVGSVPGTGHAGRVTKEDILSFIESGGPGLVPAPSPPAPSAPAPPASAAGAPAVASAPSDLWTAFYREVQHPEYPVRDADQVEPMNRIRRLTAEHMVLAKRVAPHVHSFIEIDFSAIDRIRAEGKAPLSPTRTRPTATTMATVTPACLRDR